MRLTHILTATVIAAAFILMIVALSSSSNSLQQETDAIRVVENMGFKNVQLKGYAYIGCSHGDSWIYSKRFEAVSIATGRTVTGVVCGGILKGKTVRFD